MNFLTVNRDIGWCRDSQTDLIAANRHNRDGDVVRDDDFLADLSTEHEHDESFHVEGCGRKTTIPTLGDIGKIMSDYEHLLALELPSDPAELVKQAVSYEFDGDVQGVSLRAALHRIMNRHRVRGLAYNDARSGKAYATIEGTEAKRKRILGELHAYMQSNPEVRNYGVKPTAAPASLQPVELDDQALQTMFDRQGLNDADASPDQATYRRRWAKKRYRLVENRQTRLLTGKVPDLAYKQLMGEEPVYKGQLTSPEHFGPQYWQTKTDVPKAAAEAQPRFPRIIRIYRATKEAMDDFFANGNHDWYCSDCKAGFDGDDSTCDRCGAECDSKSRKATPKVAEARDTPFTIAVDLDGTIAEKQHPFNPDTIGEPREGMREWLQIFKRHGARLIVWTVRGDEKQVADYLDENDIPYDFINENPDQPEGGSNKVIADVYWDDKGRDASNIEESGAGILDELHEHDEPEEEESPVDCYIVYRVLLDPEDILEEMHDGEGQDGDDD